MEPRISYNIGVIKELARVREKIAIFHPMDSALAIADSWEKSHVFYKNSLEIPPTEDSEDILIEKHALLDVLLVYHAWKGKYMTNRFPYLSEYK